MNKIAIILLSLCISTVSFATSAVSNSTSNQNFSFTNSAYTVKEGFRAVVTVIPHNLQERSIITIQVEGGGAVEDNDFVLPGTNGFFNIPFEKSDTTGKSFSVKTINDTKVEINKEIKVSIIKINGVLLASPITTVISIQDTQSTKGSVGSVPQSASSTDGRNIRIAIDKTTTAQNEMFKVTVTGLPSRYFSTGEILAFKREGALLTNGQYRAPGIGCGILPKYMGVSPAQWYADSLGRMEFICYPDSLNMGTVIASEQTYTFSVSAPDPIPYTNGAVTPRLTSSNTASVIVKKSGDTAIALTDYGGCSTGQGLSPSAIPRGCTDCEYIPTEWRTNLLTCKETKPDVYKWSEGTRSSILENAPECSTPIPKKDESCDLVTLRQQSKPARCSVGQKIGDVTYTCLKIGGSATDPDISGRVLDEEGNPLAGVAVKYIIIMGYGDLAPTTALGEYSGRNIPLGGGSSLRFTKPGYKVGSLTIKPGRQNDVTLVKDENTSVAPALSISPSVGTFYGGMAPGTEIKFTISNARAGDIQACYAVVRHPRAATSTCVATDYRDFSGNENWKFNSDNTLIGTFKYDPNTWGDGGIETASYFRKKPTQTDQNPTSVSATIRVVKNSAVEGGVGMRYQEPGNTNSNDLFGGYEIRDFVPEWLKNWYPSPNGGSTGLPGVGVSDGGGSGAPVGEGVPVPTGNPAYDGNVITSTVGLIGSIGSAVGSGIGSFFGAIGSAIGDFFGGSSSGGGGGGGSEGGSENGSGGGGGEKEPDPSGGGGCLIFCTDTVES